MSRYSFKRPSTSGITGYLLCQLILLFLLLVGCENDANKTNAGDGKNTKLKIAVIYDQDKVWQQSAVNSAELFATLNNNEIDCGNFQVDLAFSYVNAKDYPESAVLATNNVITVDQADLIISPMTSRSVRPMVVFARNYKTPVFAVTATSISPQKYKGTVFPMSISDAVLAKSLAKAAIANHLSNNILVLVKESDVYSKNFSNEFVNHLNQLGGHHTERYFSFINSSADKSIKQMDLSQYSAILLPFYKSDLQELVSLIRGKGYNGVFLGGDSWELESVETDVTYSPSIIAEQWHPQFSKDSTQSAFFLESYEKAFPQSPVPASAMLFDALTMTKKAICSGSHFNKTSLGRALSEISLDDGVTGPLHFSSNNILTRHPIMVKLDNGKAVLLGNDLKM